MIWKLSVTGMKARLRDYMVLFSGLVIASAIFYMFQSLATNKEFLEASNTVSVVVFIFKLGTVLLGAITIVYVLYANSFLMVLRQKTYAMFMMLGARKGKIAQIIFLETIIIGVLSTIVGILVGFGLTSVISSLLIDQLSLTVQHFSSFSILAIIWTFSFFLILFAVAALINASSIIKKPILQLLREQTTPKAFIIRPTRLLIETIIGIICLSVGYYMLTDIIKYKLVGIVVVLIAIVLGSYFLFHAISIFVLGLLKGIPSISMKKLNNFTLSQLTFRIRDYTQILTMVSILFALSMGAITVGLGFRTQAFYVSEGQTTFDLVLNNSQKVDSTKISNLDPVTNLTYSQKEDDSIVYYKAGEFNENPLPNKDINSKKVYTYNTEELSQYPDILSKLKTYETPEQSGKEINFLSDEEFDELPYERTSIQLISVHDFENSLPELKELVKINVENNPSIETSNTKELGLSNQKANIYTQMNSIYSGFQFMGFFLGLAFLTMLASCLMFKILSSATSDMSKYQMLRKIGAHKSLLKGAVRKEIGVLFILPGLLGILDVLFGLQMFTDLLNNPYEGIWLPIGIFIGLYLIYYVITVTIYSSIVLPKKKDD